MKIPISRYMAGVGIWMVFKVPSSPNHSVILNMNDLGCKYYFAALIMVLGFVCLQHS